jgi:hypothetical protein
VRRGSRHRDRRDNRLEWDGGTITGSHTGHMPVDFPYGPMYGAAAFVPVATAAAAPNPTAIPALAQVATEAFVAVGSPNGPQES